MWKLQQFMNDEAFGHYIAGQADADSCFTISIHRYKQYKYQIRVVPEWTITKTKDYEILSKIHIFLGVGHISSKRQPKHHNYTAYKRLVVQGRECEVLVRFFERFPLRANKRKDFEVWKRAVEFDLARKPIGEGKRRLWTREDLIAMLKLKLELSEIPSRVKRKQYLSPICEQEIQRLERLE